MVEVWRHSQEEILRFKTMENGVLFAAGSCWEGVDFPGDMVSSLRAIRTETDTCVVSILDIRAVKGGKYHEDVMCALPPCRIAEELREVQDFIRSRKGVEYYL